jgi:hypothetical protein
MKKLVLVSLAASTLLLSGTSFAMDKDHEKSLQELCVAVASDSRIKLVKEMKQNHLRARHVVKGLVCNGEDAITFAKLHGADKTADLLIKRSGNAGRTVVIQDIAKN